MKKYILTAVLVAFFAFLQSCKSDIGKISEAQKAMVFPGIEHAPIYVQYSAKIILKKPVVIEQIHILNDHKDIELDRYSLVNLDSGEQMDLKKELAPGTYFFSAQINKSDDFNDKTVDKLLVKFKQDQKVYTFSTQFVKGATIMHK